MGIVLASASPRRRELLEMLGVGDVKIIPARGEERAKEGLAPEELVMELASNKAREVAPQCERDELVVAADTVVWAQGKALGKPRSREEAAKMLAGLSGKQHEVYTGLALISNGEIFRDYEQSRVFFRPLSPEEISAYVATGEPMDKAGAYAVQGKAALFVRRIEGDFFNIMGLPLCKLGEMLKKQGVVIL